ncbi:MAG: hypothetical protein IJ716_12655 [Lachnospiraceae bacterium]|nr:hypothetical protein [Lachnospiraceae bacterium]
MRKTRNLYIGITIFTVLFSAIYESFSHGVYSPFMIGAAVIPFAGIVLPYTVWLKRQRIPDEMQSNSFVQELYQMAVLTFLLGSIFTGILEIYGTTNRLSKIYWVAGSSLLLAAVLMKGYGFYVRSQAVPKK